MTFSDCWNSHAPDTQTAPILQMSEARTLLIDLWMGHANQEMSGRYGKQLLDNVRWRQECAAKMGLGFALPEEQNESLLESRDKF